MILIPYGPGFLQLTPDEYATVLARGLAPGPISAPAPPGMGREQVAGAWLTTEKLAAQTGLRPGHLRAQARAGLLRHRQVGRRYLFPPDVISGLGEGRVTAPAAGDESEVIAWKR